MNLSDLVAEEMYLGERFCALVVGPGILILNVTSASGPVYSVSAVVGAAAGSALCERPPPHAAGAVCF